MAAGLGFKTFTTGEVLTAGDVNGYLMQGINVFASNAARDAAITSPQEGQFAYTKDTNSLWYYTGSAWAASGATGDIEGVTAGVGISGGGTSGTVTITNSMATEIAAKGDLIAGTGSQTFDNLTVGANNTVLTADSSTATGLKWSTPSTGALTLISTTNSSAVSGSVTYSNCFTSTYRNYLVNIDGALSAISGFIQIQMRASGTTQTTDYYGGRYQVGTSGSGYSVGQTNAASWEICDGSSNKFTISANIMTPQVGKVQMNTRYFTRNGDTGGIQHGFIDTTTSYDSMVLAFSGTFTGTVSIYGYGI